MVSLNFLIHLSEYPIFLPNITQLLVSLNKHILIQFKFAFNKSFEAHSLQPIIRFNLTLISSSNQHIRSVRQKYPEHTVFFSNVSKFNIESAFVYSINGTLVFDHVRNIASVINAELMAIFTSPPDREFLLLVPSSLHSLNDSITTNPLIPRIHLTLISFN